METRLAAITSVVLAILHAGRSSQAIHVVSGLAEQLNPTYTWWRTNHLSTGKVGQDAEANHWLTVRQKQTIVKCHETCRRSCWAVHACASLGKDYDSEPMGQNLGLVRKRDFCEAAHFNQNGYMVS